MNNYRRNKNNCPTIEKFTECFENEGFVVKDNAHTVYVKKNNKTASFNKSSEGYEFTSGPNSSYRRLRSLKTMVKKAEAYIVSANAKENVEIQLDIIKTNVKKAFELCGVDFNEYQNDCTRPWRRAYGNSNNGHYADNITSRIALKTLPEKFGFADNSGTFSLSIGRNASRSYSLNTQDSDIFLKISKFLETFENNYMVCSI